MVSACSRASSQYSPTVSGTRLPVKGGAGTCRAWFTSQMLGGIPEPAPSGARPVRRASGGLGHVPRQPNRTPPKEHQSVFRASVASNTGCSPGRARDRMLPVKGACFRLAWATCGHRALTPWQPVWRRGLAPSRAPVTPAGNIAGEVPVPSARCLLRLRLRASLTASSAGSPYRLSVPSAPPTPPPAQPPPRTPPSVRSGATLGR